MRASGKGREIVLVEGLTGEIWGWVSGATGGTRETGHGIWDTGRGGRFRLVAPIMACLKDPPTPLPCILRPLQQDSDEGHNSLPGCGYHIAIVAVVLCA